MKVGVIGSGQVAKTLAGGLAALGESVMIGSRDPEKLRLWAEEEDAEIRVGTFEDTARYGALLILAVKGAAAEDVVTSLREAIGDKVVLDTTNPIADAAPENGVLKFFTDLNRSLMERLQDAAPRARFVKAFNSVGSGLMVQPALSQQPSMFICGNDDQAKHLTAGLLETLGWDVVDMGSASAARAIEPLCMLWCIPGFLHNEWRHAFKLLR